MSERKLWLAVVIGFAAMVMPAQAQIQTNLQLGVSIKTTPYGLQVLAIAPLSSASKAGMQQGDLILKVGDQRVITGQQLDLSLQKVKGNVNITVVRPATQQTMVLTVNLEMGNPPVGNPNNQFSLGILANFLPTGPRITQVLPNSAAQKAGLVVGDTLLQVDDRRITDQMAFDLAMRTSGGKARLVIRKANGQIVTLSVTLDRQGGDNPGQLALGISAEMRPEGLRITSVVNGSPANRAGLLRGDILIQANNIRLRQPSDVQRALQRSNGFVQFLVRRVTTGNLERINVDLANNSPLPGQFDF